MELKKRVREWVASLMSRAWVGYAVAVCSTVLAVLLRWVLELCVGEVSPFLTFYPAVIVAALLGGTGPGVLAAILCSLAVDFFFIEPVGQLGPVTPQYLVQIGLFAGVNLAISIMGGRFRRAHYATRASEVRYRRLFEAAHDGVLLLDAKSRRITDANPFIARLLGYSREELLGKELWEIGLLHDAQANRAAFDQLARAGQLRYDDLPLLAKTGEPREVEFVSTVYEEDGRPVIQCSIRDISHRKQAETATANLAAIVEGSDHAILSTTLESIVTSWNAAAERLLGYPQNEIIGQSIQLIIPPDRRQEEARFLERLRAGEPVRQFETVRMAKDGRPIPVLVTLSPIRDPSGRTVGASKLIHDITQRKQDEAALREQMLLAQLRADATQALQREAPLSALLQNLAALLVERLDAAFARVWTLGPTGQTLELQASAGLYTHLDGPHGRVPVGHLKIGRIAQDRQPMVTNEVLGDAHIPNQDWARREGLVAFAGFPLLSEGHLLGVIALFARHTLSPAAVETFGATAGALAQALGRKQAEEALRRSEARLAQAVCVARLGTFDHDLSCGDIDCSPQLRDILGLAAGESLSLPALLERIPPETRQCTAEAIRRGHDPAGDGLIELEYPIAVPGSGTRWVSVRAQTFFEGQGAARRPLRTIGAVLDITEQKQFTAKLERTVQERTAKLRESVAELEAFSYALVHDMRAPLRAMTTYATIVEEEAGPRLKPSEKDLLRRLKTSCNRMDRLITDSLNYSMVVREELPLGPVNLGPLLRGLVESYPNLQAPAADIAIQIQDLTVHGNEAALTQVFSNLLGNAVKFVAPGVHPRVRVWAEKRRIGGLMDKWVNGLEGSPHQTTNPPTQQPITSRRQSETIAVAATQQPGAVSPQQSNNPSIHQSEVLVWVEDNGIGIPKDGQEKIFGMFQRMHRENEYPGTGIGLAIVKKSLERIGGQICLDSEPGRGSRFCVQLPLAEPAQSAAGLPAAA